MNADTNMPSYITIEEDLQELHIPITAAECHGLMTGIICSTEKQTLALAAVLDMHEPGDSESVLATEAKKDLGDLSQNIVEQLQNGNFGFHLLLPADETPLQNRTIALGLWCQGFLSGLGEGKVNLESDFGEEIKELLDDLAAISQVDANTALESEEDEVNYTELVEYIRVAAMTIYADILLQNKNIEANNDAKYIQ